MENDDRNCQQYRYATFDGIRRRICWLIKDYCAFCRACYLGNYMTRLLGCIGLHDRDELGNIKFNYFITKFKFAVKC